MTHVMQLSRQLLEELFAAVGAHLYPLGREVAIVVVGGANLAVMQVVERTTEDVDVIARATRKGGAWRLVPPEPFPGELVDAVSRVAKDYYLPEDWLNAVVGRQWKTGLPPGFEEDIDWRKFGYLTVGFVGRPGQICLKLFAAVDQGPRSVHWQDLIAFRPTVDEIATATAWVRDQDAGAEFQEFVTDAVNRLHLDLARD